MAPWGGPPAVVAAELRIASLHDDRSLSPTFDLPPELEARIRTNPAAWTYWQAQRPTYRKEVAFWVLSAKQEPTRERRMASLIEDSAAGRPVKPMRYGRSRE